MNSSAPWAPWSLRELVREIENGQTTPAMAQRQALTRIAETEPDLHAWTGIPAPSVESDKARGPLGGVPLGVKDIIDLRTHPTGCGAAIRQNTPPAGADAAIVRAWREAGAVPIGKTVTTEFAYFAPGPTDNPAAPGHTPGGSSSGSAAAIAAGQLPLAIGTQTAGSVTRPASFCGVAALVMTVGRYPMTGVSGLAHTLDSHGVFAADVSDLAVAWQALSGERAGSGRQLRHVYLWDAEGVAESGLTDSMRSALDRAVHSIRAAGVAVDPLPFPARIRDLTSTHARIMAYEAARRPPFDLAQLAEVSRPLRDLVHAGHAISEADYQDALREVSEARAWIGAILQDDIILGPAALGPAPAGLTATGDPVLSRAWQAIGLPVVTIPGLRDPDGLPLGLQAIGAPRAEGSLLDTAQQLRSMLPRR